MAGTRNDEKGGWTTANSLPAPDMTQVRRMLAPWLNGRHVTGVELMSGGLMNRNCRVRVGGGHESVVLRLYDRDPAACAKEIALLELVRHELPVPAVVYAEPAGGEGLPPYAVLEFIEGDSLRDVMLAGDRDAIGESAYDAGRLLGRLLAHRFPAAGLLTPALTLDSAFSAAPITGTTLLESFLQTATFLSRVDPALRDRLLRVIDEWDRHHATGATLVHGDFNSGNILVRCRAGRWSVAAILDWEFAFAGPVFCDIGNFLRYERAARQRLEPFFSRGCRDGGIDLAPDWLEAARMADLPALCELLTRPSMPDDVVREVLDLATATVEQRERIIG